MANGGAREQTLIIACCFPRNRSPCLLSLSEDFSVMIVESRDRDMGAWISAMHNSDWFGDDLSSVEEEGSELVVRNRVDQV